MSGLWRVLLREENGFLSATQYQTIHALTKTPSPKFNIATGEVLDLPQLSPLQPWQPVSRARHPEAALPSLTRLTMAHSLSPVLVTGMPFLTS